ncbi:putative bacteriophage protein [plant metagenome]|uniref:Putative bacteriophage protein n=1 Tax=plant metagenome TaxID=1297885 RepID=A0A484UQI2_9ZZZZ
MSQTDTQGPDMVLLSSPSLGEVAVSVTISESHADALQITSHPVEEGAEISDHAIRQPCEVTLECGWSNADQAAEEAAAHEQVENGQLTRPGYVDAVYSRLLALQASRMPFELVTTRRRYANMMITSLQVSSGSPGAVQVNASLKEVIIVPTRATTLPPRNAQASPSVTAETESMGSKSVQPGNPSPGGAFSSPVPEA